LYLLLFLVSKAFPAESDQNKHTALFSRQIIFPFAQQVFCWLCHWACVSHVAGQPWKKTS